MNTPSNILNVTYRDNNGLPANVTCHTIEFDGDRCFLLVNGDITQTIPTNKLVQIS